MENEEVKQPVEETTTDEASNSETTTNTESTPFKIYNTEADYDKDIKSLSMKKVNALYTELGIKSKDEIIAALELSKKYTELETNYNAIKDEYEKYKADTSSTLEANTALNRELVMTKLNISDDKEIREDFISSVEGIMTRKNISFEEAATEFSQKYPTFKKNILDDSPVRIGVDKSRETTAPSSGVEKAFAKLNSWYKTK